MVTSTIIVRWNQQVHSIIFNRTNPLSFEELIKQVKTTFKDIEISSYNFVAKGQHIIYDNQTFQQELMCVTNDIGPEITLHPKSDPSKKNKVPVIKPTVLRWTDGQETIRNHRYSPSSPLGKRTSITRQQFEDDESSTISSDDDGSCTRKDSGISMQEPSKKKQRIKSVDTSSTVLMPLSSVTSRNHPHQSYNNNSNRSSSPSPSHNYITVHPLEMRRPSTAPSSPITIKLPALSSITSSPSLESDPALPPQLAPLQQQSPQRQHFYLPGITSPHPSPITPISSSSEITVPVIIKNSTTSSSLSPPTPCLEKSHSHHSTYQRHHHHHHRYSYPQYPLPQRRPSSHPQHQQHHFYPQQKHSGQFLCEQVIEASSGRICGQTFRRSYDLSRHQTIHLKNRPFCYCDQCGKKFTRMDALRRHERVQGHTSKQHLLHHPSSSTTTTPALPSHPYQHPSTPPPPPSPSTTTTTTQGIPYSSVSSHPTRPFVDLRKTQQARV